MNSSDFMWSVIGFLLTVMILSYLIGDNFFFRFAAYTFVGATAGFLANLILSQVFLPFLIIPLIKGSWTARLLLVLPLVLLILLLLSQFPRFSDLGKIHLAYLAGLTAAIAIGGAVFGTLIPQSLATIEVFDPEGWWGLPEGRWLRITDMILMLVGTITTLSYFFIVRKFHPKNELQRRQRPVFLEVISKIGQVFIGITLGAIFSGVFSTALIGLIDRLAFIGDFFTRWTGVR